MKTVVIGGGSVGLGLACSLKAAGQDVRLAVRPNSVEALRQATLSVAGLAGAYRLGPGSIPIEDASTPSADARDCDMLIATTKTFQLAEALASFAGPHGPRAVLLLQNGLGSSEIARDVLGPDVAIYASTMMIGLERVPPAHVDIRALASPIKCGPLLGCDTAPLEAFVAAAQGGFLPIEHDLGIRQTVYFKLLFNTCMNPTGALTGLSYGALLESAPMRSLITRLAQETLSVFDADAGYKPAASGAEYVQTILSSIIFPNSAGHRSSMLQDLEAGRQTEIDALNGAVQRMAASHGLASPTHDTIIELIRAGRAL